MRGVTATTIRVAGVGDTARYAGADIGARARFGRANRSGGVNGRSIQYLGMRDDVGGSTSATTTATLVDSDGVFAVAPVVTPDFAAAPDLATRHVPYFGWALSSNFCGNDWGFSFTGCSVPPGGASTSDVWGRLVAAQLAAGGGGSRVAIMTEHTDAGAYFVRALTAGVKAAGLEVVSATADLPVPAVADYDAVARTVLASNGGHPPDAVFVMASLANVLQLQTALRAADYRVSSPTRSGTRPSWSPRQPTRTWWPRPRPSRARPTIRRWHNWSRTSAPSRRGRRSTRPSSPDTGPPTCSSRPPQRAGRKLTPESLARRANRGFTYEVPATVGPVTFPSAHDSPTPCGTLVRSTGTAFAVAQPYQCGAVAAVGG